MEALLAAGWRADYVGSDSGIESSMVAPLDVPFHGIASGKLRRYFSWENFIDPFRVVWGILQALVLCVRLKPDVVFSKGGFVSVPVVVAAWMLRIPVVSHESDVTPGLANRLAYPFCRRICVTFNETAMYLPAKKVLITGTPVRQSLLSGDRDRGLSFLGLDSTRPVLLVFGGSLGAEGINRQVRSVLPTLLAQFQVVHVAGQGNLDPSMDQAGYVQREFIGAEFGDVLAAADIVVSRAGANSLYELFCLRKPHLLIPLTAAQSRGDQIENARVFADKGYSRVIEEAALTDERFLAKVMQLLQERDAVSSRLKQFEVHDSVRQIVTELERFAGG
jgi:UDP-N-acetylglucosamine--N-acetylmuramyl-(pentapeptide) pyrophosphoryl-undecaprenol N-acetylglucosamine transferase